jgi:hypothetical protein
MENGLAIVGSSQSGTAPILDSDGNLLAELLDGRSTVFAGLDVGETVARARWPEEPPRGPARRNLMESERNREIARGIAEVSEQT